MAIGSILIAILCLMFVFHISFGAALALLLIMAGAIAIGVTVYTLKNADAAQDRPKRRIEKTVIVGSTSQKSVTSGVARGLVGNALFGTVGAIAGAGSAKSKNETTFLVVYSDGSRVTETVKTGGSQYKSYLQYLDV